jgi:hypothetical protein
MALQRVPLAEVWLKHAIQKPLKVGTGVCLAGLAGEVLG